MIILRIFLSLICIISIGWSILVFGGPPIIKRLILGYSNGAFEPFGITVSSGLDVSISRLDFVFQNQMAGAQIEGFSRAIEIEWSFFRDTPFLKIKLGPSVLKDYGTVNSVNIYTPSYQEIEWQKISLTSNIESLALNSYAKIQSLSLKGSLNLETAQLSSINVEAEKFSLADDSSIYSANLIKSYISELSFNAPLTEQFFSNALEVEDILVSEFDLIAPKATVEVSLTANSRNLQIYLKDVKLAEYGGFLESVTVDGNFNQFNELQELQIDLLDGVFFQKSPKFLEISVTVNKSEDEEYQAYIEGSIDEFEITDSGNYIGFLPSGNFLVDLALDPEAAIVTSMSEINFNTPNKTDIIASFEMGFSPDFTPKMECTLADCQLSNFDLAYKINFNGEWVSGSTNCAKSFCNLAEMDHVIRTSNTANIFKILNDEGILSPLSSFYLYGAISSGQKINGGHEVKFQF